MLYKSAEYLATVRRGIRNMGSRIIDWAVSGPELEQIVEADKPGVQCVEWNPGIKDAVILCAIGIEYAGVGIEAARILGRCMLDEAVERMCDRVRFLS